MTTTLPIHFLHRRRYPTAFSIERLFTQLGEVFVERGHRVVHSELPHYNNTLGNLRRNVSWARARVQSLTDGGRGWIHHTTGDVNAALLGLPAYCRTLMTVHDCNPLYRYPAYHPRYWFYRWMNFEWPARRAGAVTVISDKSRTELLALTNTPAGKVHLIPNFVDPAFTYRPHPFQDDRPTVLQVGVKKNKNLARLAEALRGLPCRLEVVGEPAGDDRAALERHGIDYTAAGGLTDAELRARYQNCDLLAFVSTYEGFGLPILEAQTVGRPVVTSDCSPHREVAGPGGAELVDPLDVADIRRGVCRIIEQSDHRRKLIASGRNNAAGYSVGAIADRYLNLYERLS